MPTAVEETPAPPGWVRRVLIGRDPKRTAVRVVCWVVLLLLIRAYVLLPVRIDGPSMLPTYQNHGVNFLNRLAYARSEPKRGDIVGIKLAGEHVMYLKRIIALPGETLEFRQGRAYVNGTPLEEPYVKFSCNWDQPPVTVGADEYYVVGDNRSMEFSAHVQGRAARSRIAGKALL